MHRQNMCAVLLLAILLEIVLSLSGCVTGRSAIVSTDPRVAPILLPHRPSTTIVACGATNLRYPQQLYEDGNHLFADMLDVAVEPNADELTAYVVELNSHPYDPASTPLVIRIPAVAAQPFPPPVLPTPTPSGDPYTDAQARTSVVRANAASLQTYQHVLAQQQAELVRIREAVRHETDALRQLNPPRERNSSSVFGCLALASDRLAAASGDKWLLIWSDLRGTSWSDYVPPHRLALRGVHIRVLFMPCLSAAQCRCVKAFWRSIFEQAGAGDIAFYDPAATMTLSPFFTLTSQPSQPSQPTIQPSQHGG